MKDWTTDDYIKLTSAGVILLVFAINSIASYFHTIPEVNKDAITRTSSTIETIIVLLAGYYFGSSLGSKQKSFQLEKISDATTPIGGQITQVTETKVQKEAEPIAKN